MMKAKTVPQLPTHWVIRTRSSIHSGLTDQRRLVVPLLAAVLFTAYIVYLGFAINYSFNGALALVVLTPLVASLAIYELIKYRYGAAIDDAVCAPVSIWIQHHCQWMKWVGAALAFCGITFFLCLRVVHSQRQLQSLAGLVLCTLVSYLTCKHPDKIRWRPVLWGFGLQLTLGIFILQWRPGYNAVQWLADEVNVFIFYGLDGAAEIFGDPFMLLHPFLMVLMPLVVYIGAVMALLYHLGVTQYVTQKIGWLMSITIQTTAVESMSLIANIFLSVLDTIFMMKPYIHQMTDSELHCFLVGAHSTIAGFAYGAISLFGVSTNHLLAAAVMSAPAAIAVAKLNYPETKESNFKDIKKLKLVKSGETNPIEAFSNGAVVAGKGMGVILVQVLALLSTYFFMNQVVVYLAERVGLELTIPTALSYVFMPLAYVIGIDWEDCQKVGELLGVKLVINELFAYYDLGKLNSNGLLSPRSNAVATYAICGFSSFGTLATFSGVWVAVDKNLWQKVIGQLPRVLINANISCFMCACVAGLFFEEEWGETEPNYLGRAISSLLGLIPSYRDLMGLAI